MNGKTIAAVAATAQAIRGLGRDATAQARTGRKATSEVCLARKESARSVPAIPCAVAVEPDRSRQTPPSIRARASESTRARS